MRAGIRIATYVGAVILGAGVGAYAGFEVAKAQSTASEMADVAFLSMYVHTQRTEGSDAAYEDALRTYLKYLEDRRTSDSQLFSDRVYNFDSTLTHTRLSVLASKRGARLEAEEHLDRAIQSCAKAGWRDCSGPNLLAVAQRLDKDSPLAPRGKQ